MDDDNSGAIEIDELRKAYEHLNLLKQGGGSPMNKSSVITDPFAVSPGLKRQSTALSKSRSSFMGQRQRRLTVEEINSILKKVDVD